MILNHRANGDIYNEWDINITVKKRFKMHIHIQIIKSDKDQGSVSAQLENGKQQCSKFDIKVENSYEKRT
jgi:hypothetical protein